MPGKFGSFGKPLAAASIIKSSLQNAKGKAGLRPAMSHHDSQTMNMRDRHNNLISKHIPGRRKLDASTIKVDLLVESSPLVSFGPPTESSGAMFTGQLLVTTEKETIFTLIEAKLFVSLSRKHPVIQGCNDCHGYTQEIHSWTFASSTLNQGVYKFPLSYLLHGALPATTHGSLCMLDYHISAKIKTADGECVVTGKKLELKRAFRVEEDTESVRLFQPTKISTTITHAPVIYQTNEIPVHIRLKGLLTETERTCFRWKLKRLVWRIEETEMIVSFPCTKHSPEQKESTNKETKIIGEGEENHTKTSWKSDWEAGEINVLFDIQVDPRRRRSTDVSAAGIGITISHNLVVDMVVVEEMASIRNQNHWTQTGGCRSLRVELPIRLSESEHTGIAWDEDTPPVYHDVPPSPPTYPVGDVLYVNYLDLNRDFSDSSSIEDLTLGEPLSTAGSVASSLSYLTRPPSAAGSSHSQAQLNTTVTGISPGVYGFGNMIGLSPRMQAQLNRSREAAFQQRPSTWRRPSNLSITSSRRSSLPMSEDDLLQGPEIPSARPGHD